MKHSEIIKNVMSQEMDRREFFARVGLFFLVIFGVGAWLRSFSNGQHRSKGSGYGASPYGGTEDDGKSLFEHKN